MVKEQLLAKILQLMQQDKPISMNVKGLFSVDALSADSASTLKVVFQFLCQNFDAHLTINYFGAFCFLKNSFIDVALLETYSAALDIPISMVANNSCVKPTDDKPADKTQSEGDQGPKVDNNTNKPRWKITD